MKHRSLQIASTIEAAVKEVLARGLSDPRVRGLITVTGVELSADYSRATITVSIMPEEQEQLTMHGLQAAKGYIRREAMKKLNLRDVPAFEFEVDEGLKAERKVFALLEKAAQEREARETEHGHWTSEHPGGADEEGGD